MKSEPSSVNDDNGRLLRWTISKLGGILQEPSYSN